jgi:predicted nucleic acid-binding protein
MRSETRAEAAAPLDAESSRRIVTLYVESSALLRILLEDDPRLQEMAGAFQAYLTSALTLVEVPRVLSRARREERLTADEAKDVHGRFAAFARSCTVAEITPQVRARAALDFPLEPVRSLDAIHLATVAVWGDTITPLVIASTDERVRRNAQALGYAVIPETTTS